MQRLRVSSQDFDYEVIVGRGAWGALAQYPLDRYSSVVVLTERALWKHWGTRFGRDAGLKKAATVFLAPGETSKNLRSVERVAAQLLQGGADRQSLLIAFGGGVVGDVAGFVASTYMRGIDYLQVPTTVVAQVDSGIGGKTAVNVGAMKNLVGTFYPPRLVLADPLVLSSLDERTFRSGLYEVVKHAILAGFPLFDQLEACLPSLHPGSTKTLDLILARAAEVKVEVVSRDEREADLRRTLNLGHTFGHALEEVTHYRRFLHGEAVGWGLLAVGCLAEQLGVLPPAEGQRIARLVRRVGPLPALRGLSAKKVAALLPRDKKAVGGEIYWVLPERVGKVRIQKGILPEAAARAFESLQRDGWHE